MFPVRYEMGFYIPGDGVLHIYCLENLKFYVTKYSVLQNARNKLVEEVVYIYLHVSYVCYMRL
jgi:hypothetical protein